MFRLNRRRSEHSNGVLLDDFYLGVYAEIIPAVLPTEFAVSLLESHLAKGNRKIARFIGIGRPR
jgi:hypothetical protein